MLIEVVLRIVVRDTMLQTSGVRVLGHMMYAYSVSDGCQSWRRLRSSHHKREEPRPLHRFESFVTCLGVIVVLGLTCYNQRHGKGNRKRRR